MRADQASLGLVADRRPKETDFVVGNIVLALKPGRSDRVLEIGCGDGKFLERIAPRVAGCTAVDLSPVGLARVRQALRGPANTTYSAGVSEALPFQDVTFSIVVINAVMYALGSYEEGERTVAEVRRVLQGGGIAYFGEIPTVDEGHGAHSSGRLLGRTLAKLRRHGLRTTFHLLWERRHEPVHIIAPDTFLYWSRETFTALLEKHGFQVAQVFPHETPSGVTSRLNYVAICPS